MRTKRSSLFKFVASVAVCGFLFGVSASGAATMEQNQSKVTDEGTGSKPAPRPWDPPQATKEFAPFCATSRV